ncbi:MAG TPA: CAP domain-containing protein [Paracoccaceae bacterium]|nr:CAP domain-containing protein [Paracoccaceae bacterium]
MSGHTKFLIIAAVALAATAANAADCSRLMMPAGADQPLPTAKPDQQVFGKSVLYFTNRARCDAGLQAMDFDSSLTAMSATHSDNMAAEKLMSHKTSARGQQTLAKRKRAFRVRASSVAENIGQNYVYAIAKHSIRTGAKDCAFTYAATGATVPRHSYAMMAQAVVEQWLGSSGHRANIMTPQFDRMGAGFAIAPEPQTCGRVYATQNFAG